MIKLYNQNLHVAVWWRLGLASCLKKTFLLLSTMALSSIVVIAQQDVIIRGEVKDAGTQAPIPGASVAVKGKGQGVATDANGFFSLKAPSGSRLVFTSIGYGTKEMVWSAGRVSVSLTAVNAEIGEVIVIGYGQKKKATNVGALSTVTAKELKQSPVANMSNALAGRLPGLVSQQRGGEPGRDDATLLIRGITTLSTASAGPLVLVDGVERPFSQIDFNEVESVSILKDASATAVFGVRGANGVILVTTRRGKSGKASISLSANYGLQKATRLPKFLGSYDYAMLRNEAVLNDNPNAVVPFSQQQLDGFKNKKDPYLYPDVDYVKEFIKDYTPQSNVNVNISGGGEVARYFVSGSYMDQEGIYKHTKGDFFDASSRFQRFNFRSNIDINATPTTTLSVNMAALGSIKNSPYAGGGGSGSAGDIFSGIMRTPPTEMPLLNPDGTYGASNRPARIQRNILADLQERGVSREYNNTVEMSLIAEQKLDFFLKGLVAKVNMSFNGYYTQFNDTYRGNGGDIASAYRRYSVDGVDSAGHYIYTQRTGAYSPLITTANSYANASNRNFYLEGSLFWQGKKNKHDVTALLLYNQSRKTSNVSTLDWPFSRMGFVGRVTYSYNDKYLAEINAGYNGSENFQKGQRFGFFPSVSAGWVISEEAFLKGNQVVSYLKLRASAGQVGNDVIDGRRFLFMNNPYSSGTGYSFGLSQGTSISGLVEGALPTVNATWERETSYNGGLEMNLFGKKLGLVADVFYKKRKDILTQPATTPVVTGVTLPVMNLGVVENRGFEIELNTTHKIGKATVWAKGNFSFARNKILFRDEPVPRYEWMAATGRSVGQNWGYLTDGFFNSQDEIDKRTVIANFGGRLQPGDFKYKDINGDGVINTYDQVPIGKPVYPEIMYGFSAGFNIGQFDASIMFQGAGNTSMLVGQEAAFEFFNAGKALEQHLGRWTPQTAATATYPRLSSDPTGNDNNYQNSDFWLRNASYLRLKNAEIGYSLPNRLLKRLHLTNGRWYLNGQNLFTWCRGITYLDPENRQSRGWYYPQGVVYNTGFSVTF